MYLIRHLPLRQVRQMINSKGVISGIPSKDGANQPIKYRLVELFGNTEQAVNGYATPSYSTPREITYTDIVNGNVSKDKPLAVTNTLLKTAISFTKVGNDNQTPLAGAEFTLYASDGKTQIGSPVTSDKNGLVKFDQQVPIGKYLIKETKTPLGYVKASDIDISVTAQNGQLVISGLPTGSKVKNILDDFKLIITKKIIMAMLYLVLNLNLLVQIIIIRNKNLMLVMEMYLLFKG